MPRLFQIASMGMALLCAAAPAGLAAPSAPCLTGVNVSSAEFGNLPGQYGISHIYPGRATLEALADAGVNVIRLPFRWERLQPSLFGPLSQAELGPLMETVKLIRELDMYVVLDPHNYAEYVPNRIGSGGLSLDALADFWGRLASRFSEDDSVLFLLMNEPIGITAAVWTDVANRSIASIREAGAGNLILVPGTIWTGASHWFDAQDGGSNAETLLSIEDPLNHFAFEVHQYLDDDFSGTNAACPRTADAIQALEGFSGWLRQHGYSGFLGEFGGTKAANCLSGLKDVADYMELNSDIWLGWTAWAAGEWWGDYPYSLQPAEGVFPPQMEALKPFLKQSHDARASCKLLDTPIRGKD